MDYYNSTLPLVQRVLAKLCNYRIASYNEHLQVLLKRCNSTAKLLEQLVASKNQKLAREQSNYTLTLTKAAADDSAAIRVITIITLIYLSATVVAASPSIAHFVTTTLI
jgi:hypothetical protein